jgi:hypothetical protein
MRRKRKGKKANKAVAESKRVWDDLTRQHADLLHNRIPPYGKPPYDLYRGRGKASIEVAIALFSGLNPLERVAFYSSEDPVLPNDLRYFDTWQRAYDALLLRELTLGFNDEVDLEEFEHWWVHKMGWPPKPEMSKKLADSVPRALPRHDQVVKEKLCELAAIKIGAWTSLRAIRKADILADRDLVLKSDLNGCISVKHAARLLTRLFPRVSFPSGRVPKGLTPPVPRMPRSWREVIK